MITRLSCNGCKVGISVIDKSRVTCFSLFISSPDSTVSGKVFNFVKALISLIINLDQNIN
jgi:hypothetical protein